MSRKTNKQSISYVLPIPHHGQNNSGHRLGVNAFALDATQSVLYTGGRDGVVCSWDLQDSHGHPSFPSASKASIESSAFCNRAQVHRNWITGLALIRGGETLVSASHDQAIKAWRPSATMTERPATLGYHGDFIKRLVCPDPYSPWVASGGVDKKLCLWDINGGGKRSEILVQDRDSERPEQCSVYALAAAQNILAAGGLEDVVKLWDVRSGRRIHRLVGHTDHIRDLLISRDGSIMISCSWDKDIKVWSLSMGRCVNTFRLHSSMVFSLFSEDDHLSTFYSGDKDGLIVKTKTSAIASADDGVSIGVASEHETVNGIFAAGGHLWAGTKRSSVNRWMDIDIAAPADVADSVAVSHFRPSSNARTRESVSSFMTSAPGSQIPNTERIPPSCIVRLSNTVTFPHVLRDRNRSSIYNAGTLRRPSVTHDPEMGAFKPLRDRPVDTIEGTHGLMISKLLNDRRRVLTQDNHMQVDLWDLITCKPIKSFGKCNIDSVKDEINTKDQVADWCEVDVSMGLLRCTLKEEKCFDAEVYADEIEEAKGVSFKEDHRRKWVLRYLFQQVIDEELRRDEEYRQSMIKNQASPEMTALNRPGHIRIPSTKIAVSETVRSPSVTTPKATRLPPTPGFAISAASPAAATSLSPTSSSFANSGNGTGATADQSVPASDSSRPTSSERPRDYFSPRPLAQSNNQSSTASHTAASDSALPTSPSEPDALASPKAGSSFFSKRLKASFIPRKPGKSTGPEDPKSPSAAPESVSDGVSSKSSHHGEKLQDDCFGALIEDIHAEYSSMAASGQAVTTLLSPALPGDTPVISLPSDTVIILKEEKEDAGTVDVFDEQIGSLGIHTDVVEQLAPSWLAEVLLRNAPPKKEPLKMTFVLEPKDESVPGLGAPTGTDRLNANRMLRARKVLAYIAEKLEPHAFQAEAIDLRPEEYLELWCNNKPVPPTMTLAQMKQHLFKSGGDLTLKYKDNGRRLIQSKSANPTDPTIGAAI